MQDYYMHTAVYMIMNYFIEVLTYAFARCGLVKGMSCISRCVTLTAVLFESSFSTGVIKLQIGITLCGMKKLIV